MVPYNFILLDIVRCRSGGVGCVTSLSFLHALCFVCGPAEAASMEENLAASCLEDLVTAKVKEALADEPGEIFCCC